MNVALASATRGNVALSIEPPPCAGVRLGLPAGITGFGEGPARHTPQTNNKTTIAAAISARVGFIT